MEKQISKRLTEGKYEIDGRLLTNSGFNLSWFDYFNITPNLILDIGAFDFGDSIRFKKQFPLCDIWAFELDFDNCEKYADYATKCGIRVGYSAIGDVDGCIDGFWKAKNKGHHENAQGSLLEPTEEYKSRYPYITHEYTAEKIQIRRLDSWFDSQIDLLHIDVEGGELKVLNGLGELRPTLVWVEYLVDGGWEGQNFKDVDEWFLSRGYVCELDAWPDKLWVNNNLLKNKNMTVWRTGIELIDGKLSFYDIHQAEIPQDLYDKFRWNKLIRLDIFQNNRIIFLSQDKLMLEGLWNGWHFHKDIYDVDSFINRMNSAKEQYERELSEQS